MSDAKVPSNFQQAITGTWHGLPAVFEADGTHVGFNKVSRESRFEDGRTTYTMDTNFQNSGPLRYRFDVGNTSMAFGVIDSDQDRVYCGPDFMGAGRPFGMLVDSNYYSPGWNADLRTLNLVLPERNLQVYSSELYEGPALISVFNGLYVVTQDHQTNPETQRRVESFLESEKQFASRPFLLPIKRAGTWAGELELYSSSQQHLGAIQVEIDHQPLTLLRSRADVRISGEIERRFSYERSHSGNVHTFEGPELWGNGRSFGRYLFTRQHFYGEAFKLRGRETLIDDRHSLCLVWQFYQSDREQFTAFGVLDWQAGDAALGARYVGQ